MVSATARIGRGIWAVAALLALGLLAAPTARAACAFGMVDRSPLLHFAGGVPAGQVEIEFLGHSSFVIRTPKGRSVVTDYNGYVAPPDLPDAVTMNNSHESHYTDLIDPRIPYVLRGWKPGGGIAKHDVTIEDLRVFNVPTNMDEHGDMGSNGNSVFVFEISGLCIAHVGHLHHVLTRDQLQRIGRIDVLFMPVDGTMTMMHEAALENIRLIDPRLVIPMHFGFFGAAEAFFERAKGLYPIQPEEGSTIRVSRKTLPRNTEIWFLQGRQ